MEWRGKLAVGLLLYDTGPLGIQPHRQGAIQSPMRQELPRTLPGARPPTIFRFIATVYSDKMS